MGYRYTPWPKIFSHESTPGCDVTMVIEARGHGKTWGMREQVLRDWLKDGSRFVAVSRTANRIPDVMGDFFGALAKPDREGKPSSVLMREHRFMFRRVRNTLLAYEIPREKWGAASVKVPRGAWDIVGYFVALSQAQNIKEQTFAKVRRIVFDEALIERPTPRHTYLRNEYDDLVSVVSSVTREQVEGGVLRPHVYLLANACTIANPYFERFGVDTFPPKGFSWWRGHMFLLYVGDDKEYSDAVTSRTVAGRLGALSDYNAMAADNEFQDAGTDMVCEKPRYAWFRVGVKAGEHTYGIWWDEQDARWWVGYGARDDARMFTLTTEDKRIDYQMAARNEPFFRSLADSYRLDGVRFESVACRRNFEMEVLRLFGLR